MVLFGLIGIGFSLLFKGAEGVAIEEAG